MRFTALIVVIAIFLGLCVGAYHIVEDRHDLEIRAENEELQSKIENLEQNQIAAVLRNAVEWNKARDMLLTLVPERKADIEKIFQGEEPTATMAEAEITAEQFSDLEEEGGK